MRTSCRLVCCTWYNSIKGMSSSAEAIRREAWIQAVRIKSLLNSFSNLSPSVVTTVTCLAHYGILRDVENLLLEDVDLTSVPVEHLA